MADLLVSWGSRLHRTAGKLRRVVERLNPPLVHERPQQRPTLAIKPRRVADMVQVTRHVPNQQTSVRQQPWPVIQTRLERARPLPRLDLPVPDLDFLFDRDHPCDLEDEPGRDERRLEHTARLRAQVCGVAYQRELVL